MEKRTTESVWDYPRPPRVEFFDGLIQVEHEGLRVAESSRTLRVLETSHPPAYYIPQADILMERLYSTGNKSYCEFKGEAKYWGLSINGKRLPDLAWCYENPRPGFEAITGHLAFFAGKVDACYVDGEKVDPQAGDFYGGWVTSWISGPFKGGPGTHGW